MIENGEIVKHSVSELGQSLDTNSIELVQRVLMDVRQEDVDFEDSEIEPEMEQISDLEDQISDYENESDYLPSDLEDLGFYEQ